MRCHFLVIALVAQLLSKKWCSSGHWTAVGNTATDMACLRIELQISLLEKNVLQTATLGDNKSYGTYGSVFTM